MKKPRYFIQSLFFHNNKKLLLKLLKIIQNNSDTRDGILTMSKPGICMYLFRSNKFSTEEQLILLGIIKDNKPMYVYNGGFYFKPYEFKPRQEFLIMLINKY